MASGWGTENSNKIIALGLVEIIYYTRLPVGHTHEDIDAKFAKIWKYMRLKSVLTPKVSLLTSISIN